MAFIISLTVQRPLAGRHREITDLDRRGTPHAEFEFLAGELTPDFIENDSRSLVLDPENAVPSTG